MKNLYRVLTATIVAALLLFNSCEPVDEIVIDLTPQLVAGSWTFNSVEAGSALLNGGYEIVYGGNVLSFSSDGTCTDILLGVNGAGMWSLNDTQTVLSIAITYDDGDTRNESWNIKTISDTELIYTFDLSPNTLEMRYIH